jgi:hypothetical protein
MSQQHTAVFVPPRSAPAAVPTAPEGFLTGAELESLFKISSSHRLALDQQGMPHLSIGKRRRYKVSEVETFLRQRAEQETTQP